MKKFVRGNEKKEKESCCKLQDTLFASFHCDIPISQKSRSNKLTRTKLKSFGN